MRTMRMSDLTDLGECGRDQGQIISRHWYSSEDGPILHWLDRSDGEEQWTLYRWALSDRRVVEPWNGDTSGAVGRGVRISVIDGEA